MYFKISLRVARETALKSEFSNIRRYLQLYRIINGKFPKVLTAVTKEGFTFNGGRDIIATNKYLNLGRVDKEGYLPDPFMNRYLYDNLRGAIKSQTRGCEGW